MQSLWQDLKYAVRQLRNAPAFAITAVLTLALGIGVATTVLAVVQRVLLAPLPYPEPERLVGVAFNYAGEGVNAGETGESAEFLMRTSRSFAAAALMNDSLAETAFSDGHGHVASLAIESVSEGYFRVLGAAPALGRAFTAEEDRPGAARTLVLSHALWQREFGADPGIVGKTVRLDQQAVTVVGVMPAGFRAEAYRTQTTLGTPDAWRPLQVGPKDPGYQGYNYQLWARLRPGVTIAQARAEMAALDSALYGEYPKYKTWHIDGNQLPHCAVFPLASVVANEVRPSLLVMAAAVGAVLLLASMNLAGLNTARALRRGPELALRAALGASRARLLRLALAEVALLTAAGAAGAVLVARGLLPLLLRTAPVAIPQVGGAGSSWAVAGFAAAVACLSAVLFGAPMAVAALRQAKSEALGNVRTSGATKGQARAGKLLIAAQMSLAVVLLSSAALLLGTFLKLRAQPLGFVPERLVIFQTSLRGDRYATTAASGKFVEQVLGYLRNAPDVRSAAAVSGLPLSMGLNTGGWPDVRKNLAGLTEFRAVTAGYFETIETPLLAGRGLLPTDKAGSLPVAVISATTARNWWPGRSPLGAELHLGGTRGEGTAYRVVGIAADVPGRTAAGRPPVLVYGSLAQQDDSDIRMLNGWFPITFTLRMTADVDVARIAARAVAGADPEIPVTGLATMREVVDKSVAAPRFFAQLAEGFAGFAVLLTAIGLFGLLSYQVAQRTREIGIRMALGASRERIRMGVLAASGSLVLAGGAAGLAGAALLQPLLARWVLLYVVGAGQESAFLLFNHALALLAATAVLAFVSLAAAYGPARRASRIDPIVALRSE